MSKISRNSPCPCGSGKKYKKCCSAKYGALFTAPGTNPWADASALIEASDTTNAARDLLKIFRESTDEHVFESEEELRQAFTAFKDDMNRRALPIFLGLNADQMHRISTEPIDAISDVVTLCFDLENQLILSSPIMQMALSFLLYVNTAKEVTLTEQGYLPLSVVEGMYELNPYLYEKVTESLEREESLPDLFITRKLIEVAGITVIEKGCLRLSDLGEALLDEVIQKETAVRLYQSLFVTYTNRFNWLLFSAFDNAFGFIQHTALFNLFILHKQARDYVGEATLANTYATAFPAWAEKLNRMNLVPADCTPEDVVTDAFSILFIHKYCWMFGLLEQQPNSNTDEFKYKTTPLFTKLFHWHI